jgi:hypothetical protein
MLLISDASKRQKMGILHIFLDFVFPPLLDRKVGSSMLKKVGK